MKVFRLHLRPVQLKAHEVVQHCLDNEILGLGWEGPDEVVGETTKQYLARHCEKWNSREGSVHTIMERVSAGDLIWARDASGGYLLGRVTGAPYARFGDRIDLQDMYHVVDADIVGGANGERSILDTEVPGSVKSRFSNRGRTFYQIHDQHVLNYTSWLFASKTDEPLPDFSPASFLSLLDPYELEDLVVLYLQELGWRIVLSSHSPTTPRYEVSFVHKDFGTAAVQVKQKGVSLSASDYANDHAVSRVFLFAANGQYGNAIPTNVSVIETSDLIEYAHKFRSMLPAPIRLWFDRSEEGGQGS